MAEHVEESAIRRTKIPFPPSWIDHLILWIDRLPGPVWLFYVLNIIAVAILVNAVFWIDGSIPFGSVDPINTYSAIFVYYWLALYHYLMRVGSRSLRKFRPLLDVDDSELIKIDYELATLPRWLGRFTVPLGYAYAAITILGDPAPYGDVVPHTALPYIGDIAITGFMVSTLFCLIIRSIRQLRMVRRLHTQAKKISLLKLEPAHAFSALTARTGIGCIFILIFSVIVEPSAFGTTLLDILTFFLIALLSIALFVIPILGMRDKLDEEKTRVLNETSDLLQMTSAALHGKINQGDYDDLEGMETAISSLIRERELFERISTWPWDTRTIRGFASALLLPIFLWLVTRLLERVL